MDDKFHAHRKTRRAMRSAEGKRRDAAAIGLWTLAGDWAADNGTGGFVPADELDQWDDDADTLAGRLVEAGLWSPCEVEGEPGYRFHDWQDYQPAPSQAKREGGIKGNHVRWHVNEGRFDPGCPLCVASDRSSESHSDRMTESGPIPPVPSRPDPTSTQVTSSSHVGNARAILTDDDLDKIAEKTNGDREHARRVAADVLDRAGAEVRKPLAYVLRALVENPDRYRARQRRTKDRECPTHPGQPAGRCGGCAADAKAAR